LHGGNDTGNNNGFTALGKVIGTRKQTEKYACRRSGELPSGAFWRNRYDVRYDEREFSHATVTVSANSCLFIFNFLSTNFKRLNQSMVTFGSYRLDKV